MTAGAAAAPAAVAPDLREKRLSSLERQMQIDLSAQNVVRRFGDFSAVDDVSFEVETGRFFSILGPSGCGKTTLLRMVAGFLEPSSGRIRIRGADMAGVEPNRRPVNMVFQQLALFPMMDVAENIAFGLRRRGVKGAELRKRVEEILERVGLPGFGEKKISQISGGQKQRVALARCLVLRPVVLLLDEPLGALDLKLREQMKVELKNLQQQVGTTFIYITHDQSEAMVMSDLVAVMRNGRFEQMDTPPNIYNRPATPFVAQFVGNNNRFLGRLRLAEGGRAVVEEGGRNRYFISRPEHPRSEAPVEMYVRPEAIMINPDRRLSGLNRMTAGVKTVLFDAGNSRLIVVPENSGRELMVALPQNRQYDDIRVGDRVEIGWDPASAFCFLSSAPEVDHA